MVEKTKNKILAAKWLFIIIQLKYEQEKCDCKFFFSGICFCFVLFEYFKFTIEINRVEKRFVCCYFWVKIIARGLSLSMKVGKTRKERFNIK